MDRWYEAPWIRDLVLSYISTPTLTSSSSAVSTKGTRTTRNHKHYGKIKAVQVIGYNSTLRCFLISDQQHSIFLYLINHLHTNLTTDHQTLHQLKYSQVQIKQFHVSTVIQAAGDRLPKDFITNRVSFPIALQCSDISYLGAPQLQVIGHPIDINRDEQINSKSIEWFVLFSNILSTHKEPIPRRGCLAQYR